MFALGTVLCKTLSCVGFGVGPRIELVLLSRLNLGYRLGP